MIADLIRKSRSYRRFVESEAIDRKTLEALVELARCSPSGGNVQPLKFILSCDPAKNALIFPHLSWAGRLKEWGGPAAGERPAAYVIILGDKQVAANAGVDHGIAAQSMLLGAAEKGLGGCMLGAVAREKLRAALAIPERYEILLVVALGKPAERIVLEDLPPGGETAYWRDKNDVHHVPKRPLNELIVS